MVDHTILMLTHALWIVSFPTFLFSSVSDLKKEPPSGNNMPPTIDIPSVSKALVTRLLEKEKDSNSAFSEKEKEILNLHRQDEDDDDILSLKRKLDKCIESEYVHRVRKILSSILCTHFKNEKLLPCEQLAFKEISYKTLE